mmetsp:Transcript_67770/g.201611  ORF Transcript_67770/g.201611 Transcript_67770/m.201611 type:complete len:242 (-) Transcript_67770:103-828(-)
MAALAGRPHFHPPPFGHWGGHALGYAPVPSRDTGERRKDFTAPADPDADADEKESGIQMRKAEQQAAVFDTYAICSAILTGFSCSAPYTSVSELESEDIVIFIIKNIQQWLIRLCTAMGTYSVLVFTFCAMYARSCLARPGPMGLEIYTLYMKRTSTVRVRAFYTMYAMALLYSFSVVLSCWISFGHIKALVTGFSVLAVLVLTVIDTRAMIVVASLIYASDDAVQAALAEMAEEEVEKDE